LIGIDRRQFDRLHVLHAGHYLSRDGVIGSRRGPIAALISGWVDIR
jgi:hypothetical protein